MKLFLSEPLGSENDGAREPENDTGTVFSYIKNYQRDDGSAFMDNVYNPSVKQDDEMPDKDEQSENFTPNLHQNEKRELV